MIARMNLRSAAPTGRRRALIFGVSLLALLGLNSTAAHGATFTRGFVDDVWFDTPPGTPTTNLWLARTKATGAALAQIEVDWLSVEPKAPKRGARLTSPAAAQFVWSSLDQRVEELVHAGLTPVFLVTEAPRWAEAKGGSAAEYAAAGYEVNSRALGQFAQALAKRYSGTYPNPMAPGSNLPRVRYMQAWAEANTSFHLSPQWTRVAGKTVNAGAVLYRGMLNAFYAGAHAGDPAVKVIASGLEGYGDPPFSGLNRVHPVQFLQNLLCLSATDKKVNCAGGPVHFDILGADPYDAFSPTTNALSPLDAPAPDLGRLIAAAKAAVRQGTLLPDSNKPFWVTEFGYDSKPPNPTAVSTATQAKWLEEGFYLFWRQGASAAMWYLVRDQVPPYDQNYFSGVYFRSGKKKPSFTAYRFPFVVMRWAGGNKTSVPQAWGISPVGGTVSVQFESGGGWKTLRSFHVAKDGIFDFTSSKLPHGRYRATVSGQSSLIWTY